MVKNVVYTQPQLEPVSAVSRAMVTGGSVERLIITIVECKTIIIIYYLSVNTAHGTEGRHDMSWW